MKIEIKVHSMTIKEPLFLSILCSTHNLKIVIIGWMVYERKFIHINDIMFRKKRKKERTQLKEWSFDQIFEKVGTKNL